MTIRTAFAVVTAFAASAACTRADPEGPGDSFDRSAMLASLTEHVFLPSLSTFESDAAALSTAVLAARDAPEAEATAKRAAAQAAFSTAYKSWQLLEMLQLGPAGNVGARIGGRGLRDEIYSWPLRNTCRVDQVTFSRDYEASDFFDRELVNAYGLDALEYLLFVATDDNACASPASINDPSNWPALSTDDIRSRRAAYAAAVAAQILAEAGRLVATWSESFAADFSGAGTKASSFSTAQEAVDEVFAAMFYLDRQLKDIKLAAPLGVGDACLETPTCPELVESPHADLSIEAIRANLDGFYALFVGAPVGGDANLLGFDDFLVELGASELALQMREDTDKARASAAAVDGFLTTLETNPAALEELYDEIRAIAVPLKSQFVSVLNLAVPQEGAADND